MENKKTERMPKAFIILMLSVSIMIIGFFALMMTHEFYQIQYRKIDIKNENLETEILEVEKETVKFKLQQIKSNEKTDFRN